VKVTQKEMKQKRWWKKKEKKIDDDLDRMKDGRRRVTRFVVSSFLLPQERDILRIYFFE
jgi:hypothetical protein